MIAASTSFFPSSLTAISYVVSGFKPKRDVITLLVCFTTHPFKRISYFLIVLYVPPSASSRDKLLAVFITNFNSITTP